MISLSLTSTAMPKEHFCPYLVISLLPGMDLHCAHQSCPIDRAQRQLQFLAVVSLSWEVFTPELLVTLALCISALPWLWEEVLWVKGQKKTKNSGDSGVEVALGPSLG